MSEQVVQVQDAATPSKNMRTIQAVVAGNTVQSEVVVLSSNGTDTYDGRQIRTLTSSDIVSAILTDGTGHNVAIKNTSPVSNDFGLVVRNIPSGTQPVSGTVTANQGTPNVSTNSWPTRITDGSNSLPLINSVPITIPASLPTMSTLYGIDILTGSTEGISSAIVGLGQGLLMAGGFSDNDVATPDGAILSMPAIANASPPVTSEGGMGLLSTDLNRNLRTIIQNNPNVIVSGATFDTRANLNVNVQSSVSQMQKNYWGQEQGWMSPGTW